MGSSAGRSPRCTFTLPARGGNRGGIRLGGDFGAAQAYAGCGMKCTHRCSCLRGSGQGLQQKGAGVQTSCRRMRGPSSREQGTIGRLKPGNMQRLQPTARLPTHARPRRLACRTLRQAGSPCARQQLPPTPPAAGAAAHPAAQRCAGGAAARSRQSSCRRRCRLELRPS
jgi:hypothetical protein